MTQHDLFGDMFAPSPDTEGSQLLDLSPRQTCFFALRPSAADAARLDAQIESLLAAHGVKRKRVAFERLHITLEPIGNDEDLARVEAACRAADTIRMPPIAICLDAAMSYRGSDAFVLRGADGAAGLSGIRALRTALGCALADRGFRPSPKYDPHMTLSYDPRQRVDPVAVEPISFQAAEFALVKSHVGLTRHEVLRTWPLAG